MAVAWRLTSYYHFLFVTLLYFYLNVLLDDNDTKKSTKIYKNLENKEKHTNSDKDILNKNLKIKIKSKLIIEIKFI